VKRADMIERLPEPQRGPAAGPPAGAPKGGERPPRR
jgi:hypothetical protein